MFTPEWMMQWWPMTVPAPTVTLSSMRVKELIYYGISSISLATTGSLRNGVRACTAKVTEEMYGLLEERVRNFNEDHKK